ncbi:MAG: alcohol dehydrogenase catalytic domain-containing protein [Planctomycetes bacterium]|nr:alcohol dehydrogenase catalytic domain-containing protein [Planctomycetota bacterium]
MLASVLHDFNDLVLEEVPMPEPDAGEVLVKIKACGFCATDWKAIRGKRTNVEFPLIPGHEPAGIVAGIGAGVRGFKEGDEVIIMPSGFCGICENCRVGNTHFCTNAFTTGGDGPPDVRPGSFAEYTKTAATSVFHKPRGISWEAAALTEPLSGAWKGIIHCSKLEVGEDIVIIGVGGIGLLCMMVAKAAGAGRVIVVDHSAHALANAKRLGATHCIDPAKGDVKEQIYGLIPNGPDIVLEAAGSIGAVRLMTDLRRRGTRWHLFGITTDEMFELNGGHTHFLEGRMDASFGTNPLAMSRAIRLMEKGLVDPAQIISHRFPLGKIHDAITVMDGKDRNKVMIAP